MKQDRLSILANELGGAMQSLRTSWALAIQRMGSTALPDDEVERLARLSPDPASLSDLAGLLGADAVEHLGMLKEAVDESAYSLKEWVYSLNILFHWAARHGKEARFKHMLGYIHCCTQTDTSRPLADIVEGMLDEYGYSGGTD